MRASIVAIPPLAFRANNPYHYALLTVLDTIFASFVIAPSVVAFWRSAWELMGIYVYPNDSLKSAIVSTAIGFIGHGVANFGQRFFTNTFHPDKHRLLFYFVSRLYTIVFAVVCVNGWRGPWYLLDKHTKIEFSTVLVTFTVAVVALMVMRSLRNISSIPFALVNDDPQGYFEVISMFRVPAKKTSLYILDTVFSVYVVGTLVVFVWRGAWVLMDLYLIPQNFALSSWASLAGGYAGAAIMYILQPLIRWCCERLVGAARLFVADIFVLLCFLCTVNTWRGIWNLLNIYFLPDNLELSCWITLSVCLILLILLKCSNTLLVRGVYIDGEEPGGDCVVFPIYHLRVIFEREKKKKIKKVQQDFANNLRKDSYDVPKVQPCAIITNHVALNLNCDVTEVCEINEDESSK